MSCKKEILQIKARSKAKKNQWEQKIKIVTHNQKWVDLVYLFKENKIAVHVSLDVFAVVAVKVKKWMYKERFGLMERLNLPILFQMLLTIKNTMLSTLFH